MTIHQILEGGFSLQVLQGISMENLNKKKKKEYTVTAKILAFYFLLTLFKSFFVAYFSFKLQFNFSWIYKKQEALRIGKTLPYLLAMMAKNKNFYKVFTQLAY